jgi:Zn finger protein HypA/HybF involved in hydrogenase expression
LSEFFRIEASDIPFTFRCLKCNKEVKLSIYDVMEVGDPMCCDEEMDLDQYCYFKKASGL